MLVSVVEESSLSGIPRAPSFKAVTISDGASQQNRANTRLRCEPAKGVQAAAPRHVDVQQQHVRRTTFNQLKSLVAVSGLTHQCDTRAEARKRA